MHEFLPFLFAFALPEGFPSRSSPVPPESSHESVPALACLGLKCAFLQYFPSLHSPLEKNLHAGGCAYAHSDALFVQVPFSYRKHLRNCALRCPSGELERILNMDPREPGGGHRQWRERTDAFVQGHVRALHCFIPGQQTHRRNH